MQADEQIVRLEGSVQDGPGFALVKKFQRTILLTLSLERNGDVMVPMDQHECQALIKALTRACELIDLGGAT